MSKIRGEIVLIAYASKHGSTREIAERIGARLNAAGIPVDVQAMSQVTELTHYDAFVVGSAVYFGSWMKEALTFARQHQSELAARPLWLFSSGPLGDETADGPDCDIRQKAEPKELAELLQQLQPREHVVFFGALDSHNFGFTERVIRALPAGKKLLIEGDFRDWDEIDTWADAIAQDVRAGAEVHR